MKILAQEELPRRRFVVIAGPFPPPVHGFACVTQEMAAIIASRHETMIVDMSPHRVRGGIFYHAQRSWLTIKGIVPLLRGAHRANRCFYIACEGGLGLVYTLTLATVARLLRYPIFLHHHSFAYIDARRFLMAALTIVAGAGARHIFLCQTMADRFAARYRKPVRSLILSNDAFVTAAPVGRSTASLGPMTIGLLSNLDDSKGLSIFIGVLRSAVAAGLGIQAVLAGPPASNDARLAIDDACREFGARLDYRGAVYGPDKDRFFHDIDVFIFPTMYANEAQPMVLFEAMAHGLPCISFKRGCIDDQIRGHGAVVAQNDAFIPFAISWLRERLANPELMARHRLDARIAYMKQNAASRQIAEALLDVADDYRPERR